jgi:DNA helicase-2/ATP-dependent DNA helicase PcrA
LSTSDHESREAAIHHVHGPLEILAGHGTGKTTLLLERYTHLVKERIAWPFEVLLLTFTRRAAVQMRERLQLLLGEDSDSLPIYTIHSFARLVLATATPGQRQPFKIYDPNRAFPLLKRAMSDTGLPESVWPATFVADIITDAKERGVTPEAFVTVPDSPAQQAVGRAYARYQELLAQAHAMDFADLVMSAKQLLQRDSQFLEQMRMRCRFIMVDEWQDVGLGQYELIRLVTGPAQNLFVAGSAAQSIYEWRAANYARLSEQFYGDYPQARRITLRDNFRSTEQIVRAAAALFGQAQYPDVDIVAQRGPGELIRDVRLANEHEEAAFVAGEVLSLARSGIPLKEMAVLYRTNRQSTLLEREFTHSHVPYVLPQKQRLYHRCEVRDVLTYIALAIGDDDESNLSHIVNTPPRGIGPITIRAITGDDPRLTWEHISEAIAHGQGMGLRSQAVEGLKQFHDQIAELRNTACNLKPTALIDLILDRTGYRAWLADELDGEARLSSIHDLRREAEEYDTTANFRHHPERIEADMERPDEEGVTFLTIHSAKGLQFRAVFVVGLEEGLLPYARAVEGGSEAGERRLMHVAISRARDLLYLVSVQSREHVNAGRRVYPRPSRYLACLPREIVTRHTRMRAD